MATALDIIKRGFKTATILAAGEAPSSEDASDALDLLNDLIEELNINSLMIFRDNVETFSLVAGTGSYTIGASGTFNTTRPIEIISAAIRTSDNIDTPLMVFNQEQYLRLSDKTSQGKPDVLYYDAQYTLGVIKLYPVPDAAYTLVINSNYQLSALASTSTEVTLPMGYNKILRYLLAVELCIMFGKPVPSDVAKVAFKIRQALEVTNSRSSDTTLDEFASLPRADIRAG